MANWRKKRPWIELRPATLKVRLALTLIIASAVPIVLVGYVSYYWMYMVQIDRNSEDILNQVHNVAQDLENRIDELGRSSQLLVVEGGIGRELIHYLESGSSLDRTFMYQDLMQSTANIDCNPGINVFFYYAPEYKEPVLFPNVPLAENPSVIGRQPELFVKKLLSYHGPHPSLNGQPHSLVVSLLRQMEYSGEMPIYIYIERDVSDILQSSPHQWVIHNDKDEIVYSDLEAFPIGQKFEAETQGYQIFNTEGSNPWGLHRVIPDQQYFHVINKWKWQFLIIAFVSLLVGALLAWVIWKMIYSPIRLINREIRKYSYGELNTPPPAPTGLQEFDHVLGSFQHMKERIAMLITDVEEKEKRRGQLEVEKLLVQINPHFIHNTLNTIQWIARMNGQQDIARLVSIFTRILHYNLGKKSIIVTVREEAAAIRDYIELQSIRYDHPFKVDVEVDPSTMDIQIPRFILQPLVENAMYHGGQDDDMQISVRIDKLDNGVSLRVQDNGDGMGEERLNELFRQEDIRKSGLGIGLSYVKKMLDTYYDETAALHINSSSGQGTEIFIRLPEQLKEGREEA